MSFNASFPINTVSFGFCSYNILRELHRKGISPNLFPYGDKIDLSAYNKASEDFNFYLTSCANKARKYYSRGLPNLKLWHITGSEQSVSDKTVLFTFYELDSPTEVEVNILNNQSKIVVSSSETKDVFERFGVQKEVVLCPLGFDTENFYQTQRKYYPDDTIVFGIFGKYEKRKHHLQAIRAWVKKYGGMSKYVLHTHIYNPFFKPEDNNKIVANLFDGKPKPFNVNPLPFVNTLGELNDSINAINVVIDVSGGEGWSLPSFHAVGLGKHAVVHNCSGMKEWATAENSVLINPTGKEEVYDQIFFHKGQQFNQGNIYTWNEDEFIAGCEEVIKRCKENKVNEAGLKIQQDFTWEKTTNILLEQL